MAGVSAAVGALGKVSVTRSEAFNDPQDGVGLTAVEIRQVTGLQLAGDAGGRKGDAAFEGFR